MRYYELKKRGTEVLLDAGIENADYDALTLLLHVSGLSKIQYSVGQRDEVSNAVEEQFMELLERRAKHEPLQYIIGNTGFMGYTFFCEEGVLIPRYDTEVLVDRAVKCAPSRTLHVLDLCTGSGCIGISFYLLRKEAGFTDRVVLADISDQALSLAEKNKNSLSADLEIRKTDMYSGLKDEKYDIILSNPPYIPTKVIETLSEEVRDFEPLLALDGDEDGLKFYRLIVSGAREHLEPNGMIMLEIGHDQGMAVKGLLEDAGFSNVQIISDLGGTDRVVTAEL